MRVSRRRREERERRDLRVVLAISRRASNSISFIVFWRFNTPLGMRRERERESERVKKRDKERRVRVRE